MARLQDRTLDFDNSNNNVLIEFLQSTWVAAKIYFRGCIALCLFFLFVFCSLPVYLYRWLLVKNCHKFGVAQPVSSLGNIFATEFLTNLPPRNAIVSNFVLEGNMPRDEIKMLLQTRWINALQANQLKYPELQQYVDYWMGFMVWRQDTQFDLKNHLSFHEIPEIPDEETMEEDATSERFICDLMQDLLNKPFPRGQSPWEVHVVENYKNSQLNIDKNNNKSEDVFGRGPQMTTVILRFHHSLADGFSLLYAVIEGLFQQNVGDILLPTPQESSLPTQNKLELSLGNLVKYSLRLVYDSGVFTETLIKRKQTPWHVPDRKKRWHQLYARSELIPISKVKAIKNRFGASFTATILSCLAASVKKSLESQGHPNCPGMTALSPLPLPGHPKKFRNHVTAAIFELPTDSNLNSLERLLVCQQRLEEAKRSTTPQFGLLYSKLVGSHLAVVARKLLANKVIPMGLSNFAGPAQEVHWNGRKGLSADFVAGAVTGVAGVGFMILSYRGYIRISASVEQAVMNKEQATQLIGFVCEEIDKLHTLSVSASSSSL